MLVFALRYRKPIDAVTADKGLKLRKYELDDEEWAIAQELIDILEVRLLSIFCFRDVICCGRNIRRPRSISRVIQPTFPQ
jgi:hypothetical protein